MTEGIRRIESVDLGVGRVIRDGHGWGWGLCSDIVRAGVRTKN